MSTVRSITLIRWAVFSKNRIAAVLLGSLLWSLLPSIGLPSSLSQPWVASAQDSDPATTDTDWEQAWDANSSSEPSSESSVTATPEQSETLNSTGDVNPDSPASNPSSEQVPQEFITAWINDLKQSTDRWIEVDLSDQQLTAWEGDRQVYAATVSTGRADEPTLPGVFAIQIKQEKAWMQGDNYEIPNVPYTMYYSGNYAIHGAYWHNNFGTPISNGCINLPVDQAAWLYNWASIGTTVVIEP